MVLKIDFHLEDCIGRTWQCGTIQLDFQMPQRFDINYVGADGEKHRPIMIHRVIFGSIERFIGILIEHFAGKFPLWLAPVQARILPISEKHYEAAAALRKKLVAEGMRVELDDRSEKVGYKIREAQVQKVPYMLIMGDREIEENKVNVRNRDQGEMGAVAIDELLAQLKNEINSKMLPTEVIAQD